MTNPVPREAGWRMPAEWSAQRAVWMIWPHDPSIWPGDFDLIRRQFASLIREIAEVELVELLVEDGETRSIASRFLADAEVRPDRVNYRHVETDDTWARDCGPIFVTRQASHGTEKALVCWRYNAWGNKFPHEKDKWVAAQIAGALGHPTFSPPLVLEGGSIDVNGKGLLLTTEQCLLNPNRNPSLTRGEIETALGDYLGARQVIWLGSGLEGDDTDGHVDDITRFVNEDTIATAWEPDPRDANHAALADNRRRLELARDAAGQPLNVVAITMPPRSDAPDRRLPISYLNFLIINGKVLAPTFACEHDASALEKLAKLFPGRRVVGIDCRALILGGGSIHCLTQQEPL